MSWVLTLDGNSSRNPKLAPKVCIVVGLCICHSNHLVTRVMNGKDVAVVQWLSRVWLFVTPWTASCQASLFFTISWSLIKLMSIESVMLSYYLILCCPLLLLLSIFPSIKVFSSGSAVPIRWPKYWSFSFSISPSNEYSGVISFMIDSSLLQHHSSKASIFQRSAFFIIQLSHLHMTTGKNKKLRSWHPAKKCEHLKFC